MARPRKLKYPIELEVALRLALPKKRPEDRFKFYRLVARDNLIWRLGRQPTDEELEQEIIKARTTEYDEERTKAIIQQMRHSVPIFETQNRKKRAQIAANKRWSKKN